jgi:hypothetical protein
MKGRTDISKRLISSAKPKARSAPKRPLAKYVLAILIAILSFAIAWIYVHDWPRMVSTSVPAPIILAGTGVSPEVAAAINKGRVQTAPAPILITPENADMYAGVPMDPAAPLAPYGVSLPQPGRRGAGYSRGSDHEKNT